MEVPLGAAQQYPSPSWTLSALFSQRAISVVGSGEEWDAFPREKVSEKRHGESECVISNSACLCTPSMHSPSPHTPFTSVWSVHPSACAGFRDCWLSPLNACSDCNVKCEMCCYMNAVWCWPKSVSLYMLEDPPKTKAHWGMYGIWLDSSNFSSQVLKPRTILLFRLRFMSQTRETKTDVQRWSVRSFRSKTGRMQTLGQSKGRATGNMETGELWPHESLNAQQATCGSSVMSQPTFLHAHVGERDWSELTAKLVLRIWCGYSALRYRKQ